MAKGRERNWAVRDLGKRLPPVANLWRIGNCGGNGQPGCPGCDADGALQLPGDREAAVSRVAAATGIDHVVARATPQAKLAYVEALAKAGRKVLMVGDGINDAPALAAGFTSMAPATASDIGRTAAETVFMGESIGAVPSAIAVSTAAQAIARQNFTLAVGYNVLAVPLAMAGLVSPLVAAVAMSTSSIIVIANALRLGFAQRQALAIPRAAGNRTDKPEEMRSAA